MGGAVIASRVSVHARDLTGTLPQPLIERDAFVLAMHDAFYVAVAICIIGVLSSLIRDRRKPENTHQPGRLPSDEDQLLAGVALAYLAHQIRTSNGGSYLIRAASRMVEPDGDDSRRARALRAGDEVLSPLSQALLANYLRDRGLLL